MPSEQATETKPKRAKFYTPEAIKTAENIASFVHRKLAGAPLMPADVADWLRAELEDAIQKNEAKK